MVRLRRLSPTSDAWSLAGDSPSPMRSRQVWQTPRSLERSPSGQITVPDAHDFERDPNVMYNGYGYSVGWQDLRSDSPTLRSLDERAAHFIGQLERLLPSGPGLEVFSAQTVVEAEDWGERSAVMVKQAN